VIVVPAENILQIFVWYILYIIIYKPILSIVVESNSKNYYPGKKPVERPHPTLGTFT